MFKNDLKLAWRNLKSSPLFSAINILGLTISLTIATVLFLFIHHETSFNSMYKNKDNIYRVLVETNESFNSKTYTNAPAMVAPTAIEDIPEVLDAVRMYKHGFGDAAYINTKNAEFIENSLYYADQSIIDIFDIKLIQGNAADALLQPNTAIISKTTALRYFDTDKVIGKTFKIDDDKEISITGVFEDLPVNTTLDANMYVSFATSFFSKRPTWSNSSLETYFLTAEGTVPQNLVAKMKDMLDKNVEQEAQWYSLNVQPLDQVYLYSNEFQYAYSERTGSISQVKSLTWLALLILVIACINYMNLATARSQKRALEVGVSKTLGASTSNLIKRFYAETGLMTFISILFGVALALLVLPYFNQISGKSIPLSLLLSTSFVLSIIAVWIVATLLAGSYPALYMSSLSPKKILNGGRVTTKNSATVRKGLVVLQFVASVVLIIGVFIIYNQLNYIKNKDLGFNAEQIMAISINGINDRNNVGLLEQKLLETAMVSNVGAAQGYPGKSVSGRMVHSPINDDGGLTVQTNRADAGALEVLELKFLAGKNLPVVKAISDTLIEVVINKKIADYLGYTPEEAINQNISMMPRDATIVGVVDDFNYDTLREPIGAYAFHNLDSEWKEYLLVRFNVDDLRENISTIEAVFKEVVPNVPFDYSFMDQNIEQLYLEEKRTASIAVIFSSLAIFVACLGLFGLASFTAEQRRKEISIRKVLGASVAGLVTLLSTDFIKLVAIALVIAFPISYYIMEGWLQDFSYRISIGWQPFAITGVSAVIMALLTVSFQAVRAAIANPVNALKTE
ncbi:MAG: ABC transporter permease [Psychroserpens sp.]|uniref:ABC transporter permease n=1 Tax=Psychroserpens sp. TaxID=2020870 RepID=UPI003CA7A1CB